MSITTHFEKSLHFNNVDFNSVHCTLGFYHDHGGAVSIYQAPKPNAPVFITTKTLQEYARWTRGNCTSSWSVEDALKNIGIPFQLSHDPLFKCKIVTIEPEMFPAVLDILVSLKIITPSTRQNFLPIEEKIQEVIKQRKLLSTNISPANEDALKSIMNDFVSTIVQSGEPQERVLEMIGQCCRILGGFSDDRTEDEQSSSLSTYFKRNLEFKPKDDVIRAIVKVALYYHGRLHLESSVLLRLQGKCPSLEKQRVILLDLFKNEFFTAFPISDTYKKFSITFLMNSYAAGSQDSLENYDIWLRVGSEEEKMESRKEFCERVKNTCEEMHFGISEIVGKLSDLQQKAVSELLVPKR